MVLGVISFTPQESHHFDTINTTRIFFLLSGTAAALTRQPFFARYNMILYLFYFTIPLDFTIPLIVIIEFGPGPIYAHGSSFLPNPGIIIIMIMMMVRRAEIIIIIVNRIINYNCNSDYITHESTLKTKYMTSGPKFLC